MRGTPRTWLGLVVLVVGANLLSLGLGWRLFLRTQPAPQILRERLETLATTTSADLDAVRANIEAAETRIKLTQFELAKITRWQADMFNPEKGWRREVTQTLRMLEATQKEAAADRRHLETILTARMPGRCLGLGWTSRPSDAEAHE